jgi:hypothetical protein
MNFIIAILILGVIYYIFQYAAKKYLSYAVYNFIWAILFYLCAFVMVLIEPNSKQMHTFNIVIAWIDVFIGTVYLTKSFFFIKD